jgi:mediator of RNA polymerase II transcription subunit 10
LVQYVENGRNPDIYTREFVELVRRLNQLTRGKMHAFSDFRDVLAREMSSALPEVAEDVRMVVERTGGVVFVVVVAGGWIGIGNGNHGAGGGQ